MIVERRLYYAKAGRVHDALDHVRRQFARNPWPNTVRIYSIRVGSFSQVVVELESESLAVFEETWERWSSVAFTPEMSQEWFELTNPGGGNELWTVEEIQASE